MQLGRSCTPRLVHPVVILVPVTLQFERRPYGSVNLQHTADFLHFWLVDCTNPHNIKRAREMLYFCLPNSTVNILGSAMIRYTCFQLTRLQIMLLGRQSVFQG